MFPTEKMFELEEGYIPPPPDRLSSTLSSFGNSDKKLGCRRAEVPRCILFKTEVGEQTELNTLITPEGRLVQTGV